jgi:hypothetical protein
MTRACRTSGGSTTPTPAPGRIACEVVTFVPPGDPSELPEEPAEDPWAGVREGLAADVRRVSDRLRSLSVTRLASPPGPSAGQVDQVDPVNQGPAYGSRADAGRAAATELARAAAALEAAAAGPTGPVERDLPTLSDLAVGDQVAVTGHDMLAALDLVGPAVPVWTSADENRPRTAQQVVRTAAQSLTDLRRRL